MKPERKRPRKTAWRFIVNPGQRSVNFQRRLTNYMFRVMGKTPEKAKCKKLSLGNLRAEAITGWAHEDGRTLLFLHGGGYMTGSIHTHRPLAAILSHLTKSRGVIIDYRRAPEHRFPAALEDAKIAYLELLSQGVAPEKIVIAGDSAGGGLSLALLLSLRDAKEPLPACAYLMSPWLDLNNNGQSAPFEKIGKPRLWERYLHYMALMYAGNQDRTNPLISPAYGDFHSLPPMLIQTAQKEVLRHEAILTAQKARLQGVDVTLNLYDSGVHALQNYARVSDLGMSLVKEGAIFLKAQLEK